jgi:outer membrane immunogenic protein
VGLGQSFDLLCACRRGSNQDGRSTGWTAGVGVDYAITESAVARIEYRYTSLATPGFVSFATNSAEAANRVPISDLRAGIAYKFGARSDTIKF